MAEHFDAWIRAYEVLWRRAGTGLLGDLFTADATYQAAPFDDPLVGLDAIARFWEAERDALVKRSRSPVAHLPPPLDHHADHRRPLFAI